MESARILVTNIRCRPCRRCRPAHLRSTTSSRQPPRSFTLYDQSSSAVEFVATAYRTLKFKPSGLTIMVERISECLPAPSASGAAAVFSPLFRPFSAASRPCTSAMWGLQCKVQRVQVDHNLSDVIKGRTLCRPRAHPDYWASLLVQLSVQFFCPVLLYWPARHSHSNAHSL